MSGIIACVIICILSFKFSLHSLAVKTPKSTYLQEYCLWLLGVPSMAFYGIKAFNLIQCNYDNDDLRHVFNSKILFFLAKISFTLVEMIFISYFSSYKFKASRLTNYNLFLLIIANLSM